MRGGRAAPSAGIALLALASAGGAGSACRGAPPPPPPPLEVEVTGCDVVRAGPVCELAGDRVVRLWIKAPAGVPVAVSAGSERLSPEGKPVEGGTFFGRVEVPPSADFVSVVAGAGAATSTWRLPIVPHRPSPALESAEKLRRQGKLDEAQALLDAPLHDPDPETRAQALGKLARIEKSRGHADEARRAFEEAVALDRATGRVSGEARDRFAWFHTLLYNGRRFSEARRVLDPVRDLEGAYPDARALRPYFDGLLAHTTGDLRFALRAFQEAAAREARLGLEEDRLNALEREANTLQLLGRGEEGEAILVEVQAGLGPDVPPCRKAATFQQIGWFALRAKEAGEPTRTLGSAVPILSRALTLARPPACASPSPEDVSNVLTELAQAMVLEGRPEEARRYLDEAQRAHPGADVLISAWWLDIDARIALEGGRAKEALDGYDKLAQIAEHDVLPVSRLRAVIGRARALDALGRGGEARAAYGDAEAILDDQSLLAPLGEGRETFLGRLEVVPALHVGFLLRHDAADAADAARRSRARALTALRGVDRIEDLGSEARVRWDDALGAYRRQREALEAEAKDDWRLPLDRLRAAHDARSQREAQLRASLDRALAVLGRSSLAAARDRPLPAPSEGEVILVHHPLPAGWVGFAIGGGRVLARELGVIDAGAPPDELSKRLLDPFREAIAGARRLRLLPYGPLDRIDWHALPWNGEPLIAALPVVYGVDLPARGADPSSLPARRALVVADPRSDLVGAREEAEAVVAALERVGDFRVALLQGPAAGHRAVRDALSGPDLGLVHYAGHGSFQGRDGWESGLPLADQERLSIADILALPRVPERVILSGCETARTPAEARAEGLGLAQAFVVAGAGVVVAATRPTGDRLAGRLMAALYEAWPDGSAAAVPEALRRAELAVRRETPGEDWASFRVLVP